MTQAARNDEIEVTSEMIEAGIAAYFDDNNAEYFTTIEVRLRTIFVEMVRAAPKSKITA